jgi:eukaryotic-like serine/threonine-protein kinase
MADVFLARRRSGGGIEKRLVIKRIRPENARDPGVVELFVREARVSMALSHQNIVPVFDFGRVDDALFLAMELVDGRDLGAVLARARERGETMSPQLIAFVGAECSAALAYAHAKTFEGGGHGVVHRDVTPRNILVSWSGEVRLTDFGVASLRSESDLVVRGTPAYMAPEQARKEETDGRTDLYALGMVLRVAATGEQARPTDPMAALAAARAGELPALPELPGGLGEVIARATAAKPDDRYPDARAMGAALHRVATALRGEGDSPGHQLADWLHVLFGGPGDDATTSQNPAPMEAVTFLDDGEAAVIGTATVRSMMGTVAEVNDPLIPSEAPEGPSRRTKGASRRTALWVVLVMLAIAGSAVAWAALRGNSAAAPDAAPAPAPAADAAAAPAADAAPLPAADAAPVPVPVPIDAGRTAIPRPLRIDAAPSAPPPDAAPAILRKVTIGSRPWSAFYIDGGSKRHETPETVELAPGTHRIRFVNEQAHVDTTITLDVPADRDINHVETLIPDR